MPSLQSIEKKSQDNLSKERDALCEPIAEEILQIIAKHRPSASITTDQKDHEKKLQAYGPIYKEVMELFLAKRVTTSEIIYTMSIVQSFLDIFKNFLEASIRQNTKLAEVKVWGKEAEDLTMNDIDDILRMKKPKDSEGSDVTT